MLKIYSLSVSLYCAKLRILLRHKGLEWEEIPPPGGYGSDEYKTVVPSGNLPALADSDLLLGDSEVIAEYLNENHPDPAMLPDDLVQRAKVRERSRFHDTRLEPELRKLFPHIQPDTRHAETAAAQSVELNARLAQFAVLLDRDNLPENLPLSLGDCGLPITFCWIDLLTPLMDLDIDWPHKVTHYRQRIERHPAVAEELADYRTKLHTWLPKN